MSKIAKIFSNSFTMTVSRAHIRVLLCAFIICSLCSSLAFGQGSLQRSVRISNANGNIITLYSGPGTGVFSLYFPPTANPSTTTASLLYGLGSGQLNWTSATGASLNNFLVLQSNSGNLVPTWVDATTILNGYYWSLTGNSITAAYNGTTGNFIGTTNAQPLVVGTTNTATAQPIEFYTGNSERVRVSATGNVGIGQTNPSQLLEVRNGNVLLSNSGSAGQLQLQGTSTGVTSILSGAQGATNLTYTLPIAAPAANSLLYSSGGASSNLSWTNTGSNGQILTINSGVPSWQTGAFVNYNTTTSQNTSSISSAANYLFNVSYASSASSNNALGAVITSASGTSGATNATGLTVTSTANSTGTSTGLSVTANGGSTNTAIAATGNVNLLSNGSTASVLNFQNPAGTFSTGLVAGAQTANITYTLPITAPSSNGQVLSTSTAGAMSWITPNPGTVTSVGLSLPVSVFTVTGSPVTTSGTLTGSFTTQSANTVFAGPTTGAAAVPTFRALVPADLPSLNTLAWILTGNSGTTAYNGTTGNFLGTTDAQPVVIATTNTVSAQPIEFYTNNTEKMRITSAGNVGIGQTAPTQELEVKNGNILLSNSSTTAGQLQLQGTGSGITAFVAGAQGSTSLTYTLPTSAPVASSLLYSSGGASSNLSWSNTGSNGQILTITGGVPSWQTGGFVNYNSTTAQSTAVITAADYLFNVGYAASATTNNALGAVITSTSGTSGATNATGLTITSTANGTGTSTALSVTASGGSNDYAALFTGRVGIGQAAPTQSFEVRNGNILLSNSGSAGQLQLQGTGTGVTTIASGAQGATNINYTLPTAAPTVSGQVLSSTTAGVMSWATPSTGTVTSVGLSLPVSVFTVTGSPVTTSGTLTGSFTTQSANTVFAGPTTGAAAVPTFRALVPADLPSLNTLAWILTGNSGTTAYNGTTGNFLGTTDAQPLVIATTNTVSAQPIEFYTNNTEKMRITSAGNVGIGQTAPTQELEVKNGNVLLSNSSTTAGQLQLQGTSTGVTTIASGAQGATNINYTLPTSAPSSNGQVLSSTTAGAMSWATPNLGTVTSVGLSLPVSVFTVTGSPVTTSGTLTGSFTTQSANTVFAGPTTGAAAVPTFRGLVPADLPSLNTLAWILTGNSGTTAYNGTTGNFLGTTDAQPVVIATTNTVSAQPIEFYTNNTEKMRITSAGNVGIGQTAPTQELEVRNGNELISNNSGTAGQLQLQGTGSGVTSIVSGAQGSTNLTYTLPISAPAVSSLLYSSGGASSNLSWTNTGTAGQVLTISGGVPSWQNASTVFNGWLLSGNSGTTAYNGATGNLLGTLDAQPLVLGTTFTTTPQPIEFYTNNTERMRLSSTGKLGIGTNAPNTSLDLAADFATREFNYATSMSATNNDVNFDGLGNLTALVRLASAGSAFTITGVAGGTNGKLLTIYNATGQVLTLSNQNASSAATNRIITGTGGTVTVQSGGSVNLAYSPTDQRWYINSLNDLTQLTNGFVNYNVSSAQNTAVVTSPNYLFDVGYAASATTNNALGAVITSASGTSGATNATGLTVTSTANSTGTSTGLSVTANGGSTNTAIAATGNVNLLSNGSTASTLNLQNPAGTYSTGITAGAQSANINYTLPITAPAVSSLLYSSGGASSNLSWTNTGSNGQILSMVGGVPTWQNGGFVNYNTTTPQNTATIVGGNYLFNVAYGSSATTTNALGAVISSASGTSGATSATGLTITSTANSTGTSTGLSVTASGGSNNYAALFTGRVGIGQATPTQSLEVRSGNLLLSNAGTADQLQFQGTSSGITAFQAGAQGSTNITYTLPTTAPTVSGQVLSSTTGGVMSWATAGSGTVTGSGTATRLAFWGPGPGVTSNLQDDANLYWDNTNKRLSVGSGTTPNTSLDITKDLATREYAYGTSVSGTLNDINFDGLNNLMSMVRIGNASAAFSVAGFVGGQNGKHLIVYNGSTQTMTIVNQGATSTAANRIITGTTANVTIPSGGCADFIYSASDTRWILYAISGVSGWLYTGNSGLTDNVNNYLGTLDNVPIRFVAGTGGPNTRMLMDINGNLLFGHNSGTASFTQGAGRLAFGDSLTTTRLASVPTYINRVFNMVDPNSVVRIWRFNSNAGGTDPAIELIGGTNDNQGNSANHWWDVMATGTPGVAGTGTGGQGEHMTFRRRTGASDSEYFSIFAGGNVGIGNDGVNAVPLPDTKLTIRVTDGATSTVSNAISLQHASTGNPTAGFGSALIFKAQDTTTLNQEIGHISGFWTNANHANRTGAISFSTVNAGAAATEAMRIAGNGYVGIGQTSPTQLLEVQNGNLLLSNSSGTTAQLQFEGTTTGVSTFKAGAQGSTTYNYTLPITTPTANQVLTATAITGAGPYAITLGWSTPGSAGSYVNYNTASAQNTATLGSNYLFNTAYASSATTTNALGGLIASTSGTSGTTSATGLTVNATAHGSGTATGLNVTASGGSNDYAALFTGNVGIGQSSPSQALEIQNGNLLLSNTSSAGQLQFQGTSTGTSTFQAGAQGSTTINYTLPTTVPTSNQVLAATSVSGSGPYSVSLGWIDSSNAIGSVLYAVKTSDQNVGNTNLANDNALSLSLPASETWEINGELMMTCGSSTPSAKLAFTVPSGATFRIWMNGNEDGTTNGVDNFTLNASGTAKKMTIVSTATTLISFRGWVTTSTTSGAVTLQFAQNTNSAGNNVTMKTDSYIKAIRVQ